MPNSWINTWRKPQTVETLWSEYLQGYCAIRPCPAIEMAAIPTFVVLREFWVIGQQVQAAARRGHWWVQDHYFEQRLEFLRKWEAQHRLR